jgi:hypothetical protein
MTKKSQARIERDYKKEIFKDSVSKNRAWDELNELYQTLVTGLYTVNKNLADIYKTEGLFNFIDKKAEVKATIKGLANDLEFFKGKLIAIKALHEGKKGGFKDESEFGESLTIFEEYTKYQAEYDTVIMPSVTFLLEQSGIAEQKIYAIVNQKKEDDLTNPSVISDAVIKN